MVLKGYSIMFTIFYKIQEFSTTITLIKIHHIISTMNFIKLFLLLKNYLLCFSFSNCCTTNTAVNSKMVYCKNGKKIIKTMHAHVDISHPLGHLYYIYRGAMLFQNFFFIKKMKIFFSLTAAHNAFSFS